MNSAGGDPEPERGTKDHPITESRIAPISRRESIEAVRYGVEQETLWEELVSRSRNGHFMVTRQFLGYHGNRFKDCSLLFLSGERLLAVVPLHEEGEEWISHGGTPFGGLIAAPDLSSEQTAAIFRAIGSLMQARGIRNLRYTPTPYVYHAHPFEDDIFVLHSLGGRLAGMKLAARARLPELELMQLRTRQYLRQAVPGITVETDVPVAEFWDGLTSYLEQRHLAKPVHTRGEMADLLARFPDAIKLLGIRDAQGSVVAGALFFLTDHVVRLQYAFGAGNAGVPKQSMLALNHAAITKFSLGRGWIDFGTSMNPMDGTVDWQLHMHKERSGGRGMRVETWIWDGRYA